LRIGLGHIVVAALLAMSFCVPMAFATEPTNGFSDQGLVYAPARLGLSSGLSDANAELEAAILLHPKIFRLVLPLDSLFEPPGASDTVAAPPLSEKAVQNLKRALARLQEARIPVLGAIGVDGQIPCRTVTGAESGYYKFLARYSNALSALAKALPEIQSWEPASETNVSLSPLSPSTCDASLIARDRNGNLGFTYAEKLGITLDMMYQAHSSIHEANPSAVIFMPPPASIFTLDPLAMNFGASDNSGQSVADFIAELYKLAAGHEREYFDAISWHPYMTEGAAGWTEAGTAIHKVLADHGDGDLPVETLTKLSEENFAWLNYLIVPTTMEPAASDTFCLHTNCLTPPANGPFKAHVLGTPAWIPFYLKNGLYCEYNTPETLAAAPSLEIVDVFGKHFIGVCQ
jgi:hypothetical protein